MVKMCNTIITCEVFADEALIVSLVFLSLAPLRDNLSLSRTKKV